jgi:RNA polymerase sigma factor (TIGR02999 family)
MSEITQLIEQARTGDSEASKALFVALYDELKRLARRQVDPISGPLRATSLVHEAYCKIAVGSVLAINDRQHFFAVAARVMRQVVLDAVRARKSKRRGGDLRLVALDSVILDKAGAPVRDRDLLELDEALSALEDFDPKLARLVEMRFFAGLELTEIESLTGRSVSSLKRDWRRARAFLYAELQTQPVLDRLQDPSA